MSKGWNGKLFEEMERKELIEVIDELARVYRKHVLRYEEDKAYFEAKRERDIDA